MALIWLMSIGKIKFSLLQMDYQNTVKCSKGMNISTTLNKYCRLGILIPDQAMIIWLNDRLLHDTGLQRSQLAAVCWMLSYQRPVRSCHFMLCELATINKAAQGHYGQESVYLASWGGLRGQPNDKTAVAFLGRWSLNCSMISKPTSACPFAHTYATSSAIPAGSRQKN